MATASMELRAQPPVTAAAAKRDGDYEQLGGRHLPRRMVALLGITATAFWANVSSEAPPAPVTAAAAKRDSDYEQRGGRRLPRRTIALLGTTATAFRANASSEAPFAEAHVCATSDGDCQRGAARPTACDRCSRQA
jgi:hypothetical protein